MARRSGQVKFSSGGGRRRVGTVRKKGKGTGSGLGKLGPKPTTSPFAMPGWGSPSPGGFVAMGSPYKPATPASPVAARPTVAAIPHVNAPAPTVTPADYQTNPFAIQRGDSADTQTNIGWAGKSYGDAIAGYTAQQNTLMRNMGFKEVNDPVNGRTFAKDLESNPYSESVRIRDTWQQNKGASKGQYASMGGQYSSANEYSGIANAHDEGADEYTLHENLLSGVNSIAQQRQDALFEAIQSIIGWRQADRDREALNPPDAPAQLANPATPNPNFPASGPRVGQVGGTNPWLKAHQRQAKAADKSQKAKARRQAKRAEKKAKGKGKGK